MIDDEDKWYYIKIGDTKPNGPAKIRDLDVEWRTENIRLDSLIWKEGMKEWKKIYDIPELKDYFQSNHIIRKHAGNTGQPSVC
jgi:hypothetical protein